MAVDLFKSNTTLSGLDQLELADRRKAGTFASRLWSGTWPKLLAVAIAIGIWQAVVWLEWKPPWVLPGPIEVFGVIADWIPTGAFWEAVSTTLRRSLIGFGAATVIGFAVGITVARSKVLRAGIGSMITALQTMPSIAWFPLAMVLFGINESAIFFVVVLGAAPSIANGVLAGVDYVPPLLLRAGRNIGASGLSLYRYVIAPASLPAIVAGLKQGWAFAWRSLMAGEILVIIAERDALGTRLELLRGLNDASGMLATMIVILVIGLVADAGFGAADRAVRVRWGVADANR